MLIFFQHPNLPAINYKRQKTAAFDWNPTVQRLLVLLTKDEL
jgi:hypothetical protein